MQTPNSDKNWETSSPNLCHTIALPQLPGTMQINSGTVPHTTCMTHTAPNDSCSLAPDINTLTYILTPPNTQVLESIRYSTEYSSIKKFRFAQPYLRLLFTSFVYVYKMAVRGTVRNQTPVTPPNQFFAGQMLIERTISL